MERLCPGDTQDRKTVSASHLQVLDPLEASCAGTHRQICLSQPSGKISQQMQCWDEQPVVVHYWESVRRQSMGERRGKAEVNGKNMMLFRQGHPRHIPDQTNNTITCLYVPI